MTQKFNKIIKAIHLHRQAMAGNIMADGRKRWEYYGVQLRVAQAACNYNGYILTGTRHYCPIMRMQMDAIGPKLLQEWAGFHGGTLVYEQGFTDQYGNFLSRQEAYVIAKAAGQIIRETTEPGVLYSECII